MADLGDYDISKLDPSVLTRLKQRNSGGLSRVSYEERHERECELMQVREPRQATTIPTGKRRVDGRSLRKTGRTAQVNIKTTPEAKAMLAEKAARLNLSLAAAFELAIGRLEDALPKE